MTDENARASSLAGVRYGVHLRHEDRRGSLREVWRASLFEPIAAEAAGLRPATGATFVQANISTSAAGVLRGLHVHRRQLDLWTVVAGRAFVALVDVRPLVEGSGPAVIETCELSADDWVVIPAGVAHGFLALEALELLYLVTNEYNGTDELGFAWDDPAVGVAWPAVAGNADGRPTLSDRDRANPPLAKLLGRLADSGGATGPSG